MREGEKTTPQQQRARADALLVRGRQIQNRANDRLRQGPPTLKSQSHAEMSAKVNSPEHKAAVIARREAEIAKMRVAEKEKEEKREEQKVITAKLAELEAKLSAKKEK